MRIRNFLHKGLRNLYQDEAAKGVPPAAVGKLRNMLAVLDDLQSIEDLRGLQHWKPHKLSGERKETWSLFVTRNWRLTFSIDAQEACICDLNFEDYH